MKTKYLATLAMLAAMMAPCCREVRAWPGTKQPPPQESRWQNLPLLVQDRMREDPDGKWWLSVIAPIPERVVLLPLLGKPAWWQENPRTLTLVDPIVFDNPGRTGLRELFAPLETNGKWVIECLLLAKGHAPGTVAPAAISYYMNTGDYRGLRFLGEELLRISHPRWEALRQDLEAELARDSLTISRPGWNTPFDDLVAEHALLTAEGCKLETRIEEWGEDTGDREFLLAVMGTVIEIRLTEKGWRTLREELLVETTPEAYRAAEERAADARRAETASLEAAESLRERWHLDEVLAHAAAAPKLPPGERAGETRTITLPGGAPMTLVWCPPGRFQMGSPPEEEGRRNTETRHRVTLTRGFWMAQTEVTQAQWKSVMGNNPANSSNKGRNKPVENVSWHDALVFCQKAGAPGLQLPTEAQWEYACRAGSTAPYAGTGVLDEMGWYWGNGETKTFWGGRTRKLHPVGKKTPNAWGLHDMHGNVSEWCADIFAPYPPGDATDPDGPDAGPKRVIRGGTKSRDAPDCRSASRDGSPPMLESLSTGFRPVIVPVPPPVP